MHILTNKLWQILLSPFSIVYGFIITLRNLLYDCKILPAYRIQGCPVICVGNITVGGTGKTPAVEYLADYLRRNDKKVAILSRGYGRKSAGTILVSDGEEIRTTPEISGDEPYLLATNLKEVIVVVESDRVAGAAYIKNNFHPDVIILDDGFQHRRLYRDADIVLYDCSTPLGLPLTLPGGKLREPLWNLNRADMIWLSRTDQ
jgi:tetraacyldisaccharide 4'-kinase